MPHALVYQQNGEEEFWKQHKELGPWGLNPSFQL
jgi:hypothetical protein